MRSGIMCHDEDYNNNKIIIIITTTTNKFLSTAEDVACQIELIGWL